MAKNASAEITEERVGNVENVIVSPVGDLAKKIIKLREEIKEVEASKMDLGNKSYNYLGERELTTKLRPVMQKLGLVLLPEAMITKTTQYEGKDDKKNLLTECEARYLLIDADSGASLRLSSVGAGSDSLDKGVNKASTGAYKNLLRAIGMFPSPEREDPDNTPSSRSSNKSSFSNDAGSVLLKYGEHQGKTIKQLFDENPEEVEKLANGNSKWIAGKAKEFLDSLKG